MKTLIIYNQLDQELLYTIVEGDYSRFHGVCVNSTICTGFEQEFCDFLFGTEGNYKLELSSDVSLIENKQWDKVAITTWIP